MIASAIQKLLDLAEVRIIADDVGREYTTKAVFPLKHPLPESLHMHTLTGVIDYLANDLDKLLTCNDDHLAAHVASHSVVAIRGPLIDPFEQRALYVTATVPEFKEFDFGRWYPSDEFIIGIQTKFVQDASTAEILKVAGNIQDSSVKTVSDDGVSQSVKAKSGITTVSEVRVPNPVVLRPYRTFMEVEQPSSKFIYRMKSGAGGSGSPQMALFEADGGAWRLTAMQNIEQWLRAHLPNNVHVIV